MGGEAVALVTRTVEQLQWNSGTVEQIQWNSGTVEQWNSGTTTEGTRKQIITTEEEKIIIMLNDRNDISGIKACHRSVDQKKKKLRSLQYQLKKLDKKVDMVLDKFPHLKR